MPTNTEKLTFSNTVVDFDTIVKDGVKMYKAQGLKELTGLDTEKFKQRLQNWKRTQFAPTSVYSLRGGGPRTRGTYMDHESLMSFAFSINPLLVSSDISVNIQKNRVYTQREHGALCAIEQLMNIKLTRQYYIGGYRIDGYDEVNNVAYEIDEGGHDGYDIDAETTREQYIISTLGCKIVRISV